MSIHASTASIQTEIVHQIKRAVLISDNIPHKPILKKNDVAAFYPCFRNAEAARMVLSRFRTMYPNAFVVMWMDDGGDAHNLIRAAIDYNATFAIMPPRVGASFLRTSYHYTQDFVDFYWNGVVLASTHADRVLLLEDDVWVLGPMQPMPLPYTAMSGPSPEIKVPCAKSARLLSGGGMLIRSAWIRNVTTDQALEAAKTVLLTSHRIPANYALSVLLACTHQKVLANEKQVVTVDHDYASLIQSPWTPVRIMKHEIDLIESGQASILHKMRLFYD